MSNFPNDYFTIESNFNELSSMKLELKKKGL